MRKSTLFTAAVAFAWTGLCLAHAHLQSSTPANNAQLPHAPSTLTLNFSEEAQLGVLKLGSSQGTIDVPIDRTAKPSSTVTVALPPLKPGKYDVQWSAIAHDDGHITKGTFSFTVLGS